MSISRESIPRASISPSRISVVMMAARRFGFGKPLRVFCCFSGAQVSLARELLSLEAPRAGYTRVSSRDVGKQSPGATVSRSRPPDEATRDRHVTPVPDYGSETEDCVLKIETPPIETKQAKKFIDSSRSNLQFATLHPQSVV